MEQHVIDAALERIRAALEAGQVDEAITALISLHPADQAEAFSDLKPDDQAEVLPRLNVDAAAELLEQLGDDEAAEAASRLSPGRLADVLDEMDPDEAADVLGDLPPDQAATVIAQMDAEQAEDVILLLAYDDDTAGGLMTPDFPHLRRQMTCQQAIEHLRKLHPETETPYYLYVLDRDGKLIGVVGLRDLIISDPDTTIESVMKPDLITVPLGTDQEECARIIARYGLLALPVVGPDGRLVGVIHNDDIVEVMEEEATEDMYRLANVSDSDEHVFSPVTRSVRSRLPWLIVNLGTAFLAAWVVSLFESTIARVAVLAALQSIVAGQGGNSATQSLTVIVRGMALGEVETKDALRAMTREASLGVLNGVAIGVIVGVGAYLWKGKPVLGLIIGLAMIGNMIAGGIAGAFVPLTLKALKLDPALASAVIVTTVTDCVGFALFLGLATVLLPYLT
ncbi:MAG: magnesium transporter [Chloroflexi bacterium]|nr:magnesium transporter [Chloroflexota bacterium]